MMMLPLVTSLVAISIIQAKHVLIETKNNNIEHQVDAGRPVLPIEAKEEYKSPIEAKEYKSPPKMK